jgi:hypothetical protein
MPPLDDPIIDELRDITGRLSSLSRSQPWPRPKSVVLRPETVSLNDLMKSTNTKPLPLLEFELNFVMRRTYRQGMPGERQVNSNPDLLERFLCLAEARDSDLQRFASRFGPLLVFCRQQASELEDYVVITESCNVWRYLASFMRSLLRIGAAFHAGRSPDPRDWSAIGEYPRLVERAGAESKPEMDVLGTLLRGEYGWFALAYYIRSHKTRNRKYWVRLLNTLVELGRVRPWVVWDNSSTRPQLVFAGPSLLSYLVLQLCLRASKLDSFVLCSYCNREYLPPRRAPKIGQRNFCPECRKAGMPTRVAQRDLLARRRKKEN